MNKRIQIFCSLLPILPDPHHQHWAIIFLECKLIVLRCVALHALSFTSSMNSIHGSLRTIDNVLCIISSNKQAIKLYILLTVQSTLQISFDGDSDFNDERMIMMMMIILNSQVVIKMNCIYHITSQMYIMTEEIPEEENKKRKECRYKKKFCCILHFKNFNLTCLSITFIFTLIIRHFNVSDYVTHKS